jgi:phosphoribosylanthranilate isomerase
VFAAIAMNKPNPVGWAMMWQPNMISAFLLDSGGTSMNGGSGKPFDWRASGESIAVIKRLGNVIVAGGLSPENVREAIKITHPWGVDVSSGVEARAGKKDPKKVRAFIQAVRDAGKTNSRNEWLPL